MFIYFAQPLVVYMRNRFFNFAQSVVLYETIIFVTLKYNKSFFFVFFYNIFLILLLFFTSLLKIKLLFYKKKSEEPSFRTFYHRFHEDFIITSLVPFFTLPSSSANAVEVIVLPSASVYVSVVVTAFSNEHPITVNAAVATKAIATIF